MGWGPCCLGAGLWLQLSLDLGPQRGALFSAADLRECRATSQAPGREGSLGLVPPSRWGLVGREGLTALFVFKQMDPVLVSEHFHLVAVPAGGPWPF